MYVCMSVMYVCMFVCDSGREVPTTSDADFVGDDSFTFSLIDSFGRESVPGTYTVHTYAPCLYVLTRDSK
jgi:hypothetical protein